MTLLLITAHRSRAALAAARKVSFVFRSRPVVIFRFPAQCSCFVGTTRPVCVSASPLFCPKRLISCNFSDFIVSYFALVWRTDFGCSKRPCFLSAPVGDSRQKYKRRSPSSRLRSDDSTTRRSQFCTRNIVLHRPSSRTPCREICVRR